METKGTKTILLVLFLILLLAAVFALEKYTASSGDLVDTSTQKIQLPQKVILIGGGKNPDWSLRLTGVENNPQYHVDLTLDNEKTTFSGMLAKTWQESYDKEFQYRGDVTGGIDDPKISKNIIIYFENKTCLDASGTSHPLTVNLNLHSEKGLTGCADK